MSRWKVNWATLAVLGVVAFLMLLILVLPDIDLPDTAFHRGTAPVVVHARVTMAPFAITVVLAIPTRNGIELAWNWLRTHNFTPTSHPNFRPILLRSIRC